MRNVVAPLLALVAALPAGAVEIEDGRLSINGFGSWGYGYATHHNRYDLAGPDGQFGGGDMALALSGRMSERAVGAAQIRFAQLGGQEVQLDFAFGEWRFSDLARLRIGVVKHPFGIFGEVPYVGTLRPFFTLPKSVYGATEMTGAGVRGASLGGTMPAGSWRVSYDLYGGSLRLPVSNVVDLVSEPPPGPGSSGPPPAPAPREFAVSFEETKYILGGRLLLATPLEGLDVRFSAYGTAIGGDNAPRAVAGPSVQYVGERLSLRAEYFFLYENGDSQRDRQRTHAAYVQGAWFLTEQVQVGARLELYQFNLAGLRAGSIGQHREAAATVNYWFDPGFVVKLSLHAIDGNRFAKPATLDGPPASTPLERTTLVTLLGTQFSF